MVSAGREEQVQQLDVCRVRVWHCRHDASGRGALRPARVGVGVLRFWSIGNPLVLSVVIPGLRQP